MLLLYVAETGDINSVGAIAFGGAIFVARNRAISAGAHDVVYEARPGDDEEHDVERAARRLELHVEQVEVAIAESVIAAE